MEQDADRKPESLKKNSSSVEAVPFLEECRIVNSDKAELLVFDVSNEMKKSESLSDWGTLVDTYGDYEGDVYEYKQTHTDKDAKAWAKTRLKTTMKLKEWNTVSEKQPPKFLDLTLVELVLVVPK